VQWLLLLLLLSGWLLEREVEGLMQQLLLASLLEYSFLCGQQEEVLEPPLEFLEPLTCWMKD
jgi:hypothetical protein